MTTTQLTNTKKEILKSKESTFTLELIGSINIHESKDFDFVIARYLTKGKKIQSLKPGSHYGF